MPQSREDYPAVSENFAFFMAAYDHFANIHAAEEGAIASHRVARAFRSMAFL